MKYVIVTVEWLTQRGFIIQDHWRKSIDGSKVILHSNQVQPFLTEEVKQYEFDSKEFNDILNSEEWTEAKL